MNTSFVYLNIYSDFFNIIFIINYGLQEGGCNRSFARLENLKIHNRWDTAFSSSSASSTAWSLLDTHHNRPHIHNGQVAHWREAVPVQVCSAQQLQQGFQQQQRQGEARADPQGSGRGEFVCLLQLLHWFVCLQLLHWFVCLQSIKALADRQEWVDAKHRYWWRNIGLRIAWQAVFDFDLKRNQDLNSCGEGSQSIWQMLWSTIGQHPMMFCQ